MDAKLLRDVRDLVLDKVEWAHEMGRVCKFTTVYSAILLNYAEVPYREVERVADRALQHHRRAGRIRYDRERRGWVPVDGGAK